MKAVIMAGGKGSRLRPLTCNKPKPMVPVLNRPVMEYAVELLKKHDISEIAVTLQYLPEVIMDYFGDGSRYGVNLHYFAEQIPLGTAGSIKNAEDFLDETFIVISGDGITDYDLTKAMEYHRQKGGLVTIVMAKVQHPLEYGVIMCDDHDRIIRFLEKPSWGEVFSDTVNTGIYILEPEIFRYFAKNTFFDFSKDLFPALLADGQAMFGFLANGYWSDIGSLEQYRQTHHDILDGLLQAEIKGRRLGDGVWAGEGTLLEPGVKILEKPVFLGDNCRIEPGVELGRYTVLGNNNTVLQGTSIKRTIMWDYNHLGNAVELRGTTICSHCRVEANSALFEGSVIGVNTQIGKRVIIKPQVKVWPEKIVADNSILVKSLIWGEASRRNLFSTFGISGSANLEISPELVVRLGVAHGSTLPQGKHVVFSSDVAKNSQILKTAYIAGLLSTGVNVLDIGITTTPVTRYAVKSLRAQAGVHIRMLPDVENARVIIELLDEHGINISHELERKIENAYLQEDFRRVEVKRLGAKEYVPQMVEAYREALLKTVNQDLVRRGRFRILVAYDYRTLGWFFPPMLDALGCQVTTVNSMDYVLQDIRRIVIDNQMQMGLMMNSNGDDLILISSNGDVICDEKLVALWANIAFDRMGEKEIGVPVTASSAVETVASKMGGRVIRTRIHPRDVMEITKERMFQPLFDGTYLFLRTLEFLQVKGTDLTSLAGSLPKSVIFKRDVECPWEVKGTVMRRLLEDAKKTGVELIDGVKVYSEGGWTLVLPDSEEPVFRVVSEADSYEKAEKMVNFFASKIDEYKSAG